MGYESIDKLQKCLQEKYFARTEAPKKAAGRALGTLVEIITFYLIKNWGLEANTAIERSLPEYANPDIMHNVEFTLHGSRKIAESKYDEKMLPLTSAKICRRSLSAERENLERKGKILIDKSNILCNACTIAESKISHLLVNAYAKTELKQYELYELTNHPFAMFECKRVGVEEGQRKGPQTIEKAKQGSYVARTVSSLQRVRLIDGSIGGFIHVSKDGPQVGNYHSLLDQIIQSNEVELLENFILTIGIVSNHGNWFTSENPNKELKILAQSYDWLLFLTDSGISEFIEELLLNPSEEYKAIQKAFENSYKEGKKKNIFTKVRIDSQADAALNGFFQKNMAKIENWINVISPKEGSLAKLKEDLKTLAAKNWWEIYR